MENQIVDIEFEDGMSEIAQIVKDTADGYEVRLLEYDRGGRYIFGDAEYIVPKESVSGFYDTTDLEDTGLYEKVNDTQYELVDQSDPEVYIDTEDEEESESESDISLCEDELD